VYYNYQTIAGDNVRMADPWLDEEQLAALFAVHAASAPGPARNSHGRVEAPGESGVCIAPSLDDGCGPLGGPDRGPLAVACHYFLLAPVGVQAGVQSRVRMTLGDGELVSMTLPDVPMNEPG
jgi:hypothetical protein